MGVSEKDRCRPLTHHCYTISEPGWKTSLCCPKPCRDPTPLYINNQCLSIAHREDPCQLHQQVFFFFTHYVNLSIFPSFTSPN